MELLILRHAEAASGFAGPDEERPLTHGTIYLSEPVTPGAVAHEFAHAASNIGHGRVMEEEFCQTLEEMVDAFYEVYDEEIPELFGNGLGEYTKLKED